MMFLHSSPQEITPEENKNLLHPFSQVALESQIQVGRSVKATNKALT